VSINRLTEIARVVNETYDAETRPRCQSLVTETSEWRDRDVGVTVTRRDQDVGAITPRRDRDETFKTTSNN